MTLEELVEHHRRVTLLREAAAEVARCQETAFGLDHQLGHVFDWLLAESETLEPGDPMTLESMEERGRHQDVLEGAVGVLEDAYHSLDALTEHVADIHTELYGEVYCRTSI